MSVELEALLDSLDGRRRHVLTAVEGLGESDLRRPVLPSGWSCLGLVQHLTVDVETFWFRCVVAGDRPAIDALGDESGWAVDPDRSSAQILDAYRLETAEADRLVRAAGLDAAPLWWPDFFGSFRLESVREVALHVLTETATHAGHLDVVRELLDGRQHLVLT